MPRCHAPFAALLLLALTTGCASTPATRFYTLHQPGMAPQPAGDGLRVAVEEFQVDPPYDREQLVYRVGEDAPEVGFYAYHRWATPLSQMLPLHAAQQLATVPGIRSLSPAAEGTPYDVRLSGRLRMLEEVDSPAGQQVRVSLELHLRDPQGELLWSTAVSAKSSGQADNVGQVVEHMRLALDEALARAGRDLGQALATRSP